MGVACQSACVSHVLSGRVAVPATQPCRWSLYSVRSLVSARSRHTRIACTPALSKLAPTSLIGYVHHSPDCIPRMYGPTGFIGPAL